MGRLSKTELLRVVEGAIREGGWNLLYLTSSGKHPARYHIYRDDRTLRVKIYVWNLTHGGRNRPLDEWRIQVTGFDRFDPEIGGKTLILGWWNETNVFAGFDYRRHAGPLGRSPSFQLRASALYAAALNGFAPHNKGNGELAIAFRPDFLGTYIENLEVLHECGRTDKEFDLLRQIGENPNNVADDDIERITASKRKYAVISTRRALRASNFRDRVLTAYGHHCAICGLQLRLLDGAHILPAEHPDSTDGTDNGLALCVLHHRAYDQAFVTFDADYRVRINETVADELKSADLADGLDGFKDALRPILRLPPDRKDRPARRYIEEANHLRGWLR